MAMFLFLEQYKCSVIYRGVTYKTMYAEKSRAGGVTSVNSAFRIWSSFVNFDSTQRWLYGQIHYFLHFIIGDEHMELAYVDIFQPGTIDSKTNLPIIDISKKYPNAHYIHFKQVNAPVMLAKHPTDILTNQTTEAIKNKRFVLLAVADATPEVRQTGAARR
jgi:hypothetical protein